MTTQDFIKKLDNQYEKIADAKFLLLPVTEVHARQVKRIFVEGIGGDGAKIGQYSTKPMLASKEQFVKESAFKQSFVDPDTGAIVDSPMDGDKAFWLTFKNKKTGVKNKKATPLMFLGGGYKEFKKIQGRESNFVNLKLTNNLNFDFTNSLTLEGDIYMTGTKRKENSDKVEWMSDKYGKETFKLTKEEKELFTKAVKEKILGILRENKALIVKK
jgi:hypothetical protein